MKITKQSLIGDFYIPSSDVIIVCDALRSSATQAAILASGVEKVYLFKNMIEYLKNRKVVGSGFPIFTYSSNFPHYDDDDDEIEDADSENKVHVRTINKLEGDKVHQYNISPLAIITKEFQVTKSVSFFGSVQSNALISASEAAKYVLAGGVVNANAVINWTKLLNPKKVSLIIVGDPEFDRIMPYNELCGEYFAKRLMDEPIDKQEFLTELKATVQPYIQGVSKQTLEQIEFCLELDRLNIVPLVQTETKKRVPLIYLKSAK